MRSGEVLKPRGRIEIGSKVVRARFLILLIAVLLLIPSAIGYFSTRVNYDMLTYLPDSMETIKGQDILMKDFNKGGFTLIVVEDMQPEDVNEMASRIKQVEHVETVLNFDEIIDPSIPQDLYPEEIREQFRNEDATMIAVFFDTSTSDEGSINALTEIRKIVSKTSYVSGMTALVADLKNIAETEEPKYIVIAAVLSLIAMMLLLDSYLIPFVFFASIGMAIIYNLGSNMFMGEIAYVTKAIAAVLQLGVTLDYSIFLWHSYIENLETEPDRKKAMARAIDDTLVSVTGSSVTTVAGFLALCFMSYTMGVNLGIVMAKGCVIGVIASVTVLPALILLFDKVLMKTRHKPLMPNMKKIAHILTSKPAVVALLFVLLAFPAVYGYMHARTSYDLSALFRGPNGLDYEHAPYLRADEKLAEDFGISCTHMIIADADMKQKDGYDMCSEIRDVDGVRQVLGIDAFLDPSVPREMLPDRITDTLISNGHQLILVNSEYRVSTDECNRQVDEIKAITHKYDKTSSVIGEGPATKDLIELTSKDFRNVNIISIGAVFLIIFLVLKSWTLPFILILVIEFAIYVNLGIPGYTGLVTPFIVPVCISTIQLGSTVDYAILMSTRYKTERMAGKPKRAAVETSVETSIPSIIVSAFGFFSATAGVGMYSDIGMISILCNMMARGAIISMVTVIIVLPSLLLLLDGLIVKTTKGLRELKTESTEAPRELKTAENGSH
ncbi:MAG: MMPL family transporter [Eubacterium sp.]|nr:MMPL family transporter [Eubacterium sp.]